MLGTWVFSKQAELTCVRVGHMSRMSLALGVCVGVCVGGVLASTQPSPLYPLLTLPAPSTG